MSNQPEDLSKLTPMMRQYYTLKKDAMGAVLLFRMGDFYEIFGDDAELVAPLLNIVLTSRERGDKNRIPFCGVPHHAMHGYLIKLLGHGHKVAIADQTENPKDAKGLVKREIVRIYTPGCIDEIEGLSSENKNFIMCVFEDPTTRAWYGAFADISTGELRAGKIGSAEDLSEFVRATGPRELLIREFTRQKIAKLFSGMIEDGRLHLSAVSENIINGDRACDSLLKPLAGIEVKKDPSSAKAVAGILDYVSRLKLPITQFLSVKPLTDSGSITLSETAVRDLELFETTRRRRREGSLFHTINHTKTPMGARLLGWSMSRPLASEKDLVSRKEAAKAAVGLGIQKIEELRLTLKGTSDVERIFTRILSARAHVTELTKLRLSLEAVLATAQKLAQDLPTLKKSSPFFERLETLMQGALPVHSLLENALSENPVALGKGTDVFKKGYSSELDELTDTIEHGQSKIDAYEHALRKETGITSLKIKRHKTFGLLLEVTKSNLSKVPSYFVRRQTMVNCERFVTDDLRELDEKITSAGDHAVAIERSLYEKLLTDLSLHHKTMTELSEAIGYYDLYLSFGYLVHEKGYCYAESNSSSDIALEGSRHPVVEKFVGSEHYMANHIQISKDTKQILITGPNMAGKSTVMRQVALSAILHQIGAPVPASKAVLPIFDGIYTRVGASDDLASGQSTFMVEMSETAHILRSATSNSLIILDEIGRGTSTEDGLAIASAILEDISSRLKGWTLFATHYHELVAFSRTFPSVKPMQTEVIEKEGERLERELIFTHRLVEGASASSFGIEAAKLAGIPQMVLDRARNLLAHEAEEAAKPINSESCSAGTNTTNNGPNSSKTSEVLHPGRENSPIEADLSHATFQGRGSRNTHDDHSSDMAHWSDLIETIRSTKINKLTPLQALNLIAKWQEDIDAPAPQSAVGLFKELN